MRYLPLLVMASAASLAIGQAPPDTGGAYLMSARTMKAQLVGRDKVTRLLGEVEIVHGSTVLRGDSARVSTLRQQALVWGRVSVTDRDVRMTGRRASYHKETGRAAMHGNPEARDQQWILTADSLAYFRGASRSEAYGNVLIRDTSDLQRARGDLGRYWHQQGYGVLEGGPVLELRERGRKTARVIASERMEVYRQGGMAVASGNVRYAQDTLEHPEGVDWRALLSSETGLRAACGRATYYRDQGRLVLEQEPRAWQPDADLEAGVMALSFRGDTIRGLEAFDSVALRQFLPAAKDTDLLLCDSLWAEFREGKLARALSSGNVWSRYHQSDRGRRLGSNVVQSRVMEFFFDDGRLSRIVIPTPALGAFIGGEGP